MLNFQSGQLRKIQIVILLSVKNKKNSNEIYHFDELSPLSQLYKIR